MTRRLTQSFALSLSLLMAQMLCFSTAMADPGHGRGRGRERRHHDRGRTHLPPGQAKKADKFVNGHDARDGRWDGRGPKRNRHRW
ncbi:MAG TPA: hypothetical protein VNQ79_18325 [Blastocatellia bacterium]|nr:hypothetical protein [Blastocatellia bacterium]